LRPLTIEHCAVASRYTLRDEAFLPSISFDLVPLSFESMTHKTMLEHWRQIFQQHYENLFCSILTSSQIENLGTDIERSVYQFWFYTVSQAEFVLHRHYLLRQIVQIEYALFHELGERLACANLHKPHFLLVGSIQKLSCLSACIEEWMSVADGLLCAFPEFVAQRRQTFASFAQVMQKRANWYSMLHHQAASSLSSSSSSSSSSLPSYSSSSLPVIWPVPSSSTASLSPNV
jgi:hypothetical protein